MSYTNNREYRQALRDFFQMKCDNISDNTTIEDLDEETLDEMNYDEDSVGIAMNEIYKKTKRIPVFCQIYEIAAGNMFSLDHEIGLAVLLSYDYFPCFKQFYQKFIDLYENANTIIEYSVDAISEQLECTPEYEQLLKLITPNRR